MHEHWMEKAILLAQQAGKKSEVPVGAILVNQGEIIGRGMNCREETGSTLAHAELEALKDYNERSKSWRVPTGTSLYVTAEPCLMCTGALLWARVDHIFYGCSDPKNAGLKRLEPAINEGAFDHRFQTMEGGLKQEVCAGLMTDFFAKRRQHDVARFAPESLQSETHDRHQPSPSPRIV